MMNEAKKELLHKRGQKIAIKEEKFSSSDNDEIVIFTLGVEKYGIESKFIKEIYPLKGITQLPLSPPFILGLTNVRRKILPVINLKVLFEIPALDSIVGHDIIILNGFEMEFAILIDGLLGVSQISKSERLETLPTLTGIRLEFLKGITKDHIILLDGEKLLTSKKLVLHAAET